MKSMVAKYRSKMRKRFKSVRMTKIAKDVGKSQLYLHQPNKRGNANGDRRNDDRNKAQTHGVTSKVASKEIPKTSNWKESLYSSKSYNATVNTSSKSSNALTSSSSRLHMLSPSQGIRSLSSKRREVRRKEEVMLGCHDHSWKNACPMRSEQSTRREERGKGKMRQDHHDHLGKSAHKISSEPSTWREERGHEKVTQDRQIRLGENAHPVRSEPSTWREERGNEKMPQDHPNPLQKDGLRISNECSEHSTPNPMNNIILNKRKSEGCSQGRIPNALGRGEDVGNVESTGGRKEKMGKKHKTNVNDVREDSRHLASNDSIVQKKYRGFEANEDGQDSRLVKDGISGVPIPTISEAIMGHCSLPVYEPIWSGIFKIDSKEYVSLAGHLSTKSCESVCMLSRSLCALVNVTKHSRLEVWPASLGTSGFTDENIALFLFPPKMRPDGKLDQLLKEVIENDLALRAVMGKTEMLMFPSTMLPKQYQAFQGKHYLWGLFRPRKDIVGIAEEQAAHAMSPMENAMCVENQEGSKDGTERVEFSGVPEPNMDTEPQDPKGAEMQDAANPNMAPAIGGSNASRANQPSMAATEPANREQIDSSLGIPQGRMFAFVAQPTPRFEELMQELEREGALIATMPRVTYGPGHGRSQATTAKE